jgi:hypothetical protein
MKNVPVFIPEKLNIVLVPGDRGHRVKVKSFFLKGHEDHALGCTADSHNILCQYLSALIH